MVIDEIVALYTTNQYFRLTSIFVIVIFVARFLMLFLKSALLKITSKTKTTFDDRVVNKLFDPAFLLITFLALKVFLLNIGLSEKLTNFARAGINSLIILVGGYIAIIFFNFVIDNWGKVWAKKSKSKIDDQLVAIFHKVSHIVIWVILILLVLDMWGVQIGPMLASLGIAGLAIAFALQASLANIFGGVSLILDKAFKSGDVIKLDDGTVGTVMNIGLRSTKIRTFDNEVITVPNGNLSTTKIQNFEPPDPSIRVVIPFGVAYGSNIQKVKKLVLKEVTKVPHMLKIPEPHVKFLEMANSSLNFKLFFFIEKYDYIYVAMDAANELIYNALNKAGISIPFPQMDVHLKKN